jgi:anaerobic dimethyl sulfoxide reductase subunit B (iron-sulfur subunit)
MQETGKYMEKWGFYFDQTRCVNCKACILACKAWNEDKRGDAAFHPELSWLETGQYDEPRAYDNLPGNEGQLNFKEFSKYHMKEDWRRVYTREFGSRPPDVDVLHFCVSCNHCEEPVCIQACPMGYIIKESEFGIVHIDQSKTCIGCRRCQKVCPWDSPQFYDNDQASFTKNNPKRPRMTKCDLCIDRIRAGQKPACVAACIMRALDAGPMDELKARYPDWTNLFDPFPDGKLPDWDTDTKPNLIIKAKKRRA